MNLAKNRNVCNFLFEYNVKITKKKREKKHLKFIRNSKNSITKISLLNFKFFEQNLNL